MASVKDPLNVCKAIQSEDASKWEATMQEEYDSLMANGTWQLAALSKIVRVLDASRCFIRKMTLRVK